MFFLQDERRDNKSHILLLHSYARYLESSVSLFTDCLHFSPVAPQTAIYDLHNIDNDTFSQNHILF